MGVLPLAPVGGGLLAYLGIRACEQARIRVDQAAVALTGGDGIAEPRPRLRDEAADVARDPLDVAARRRGDAEQHHLGHASRVLLGVREAELGAPRPAEDEPPLDAELRPQQLDVGDLVRGRLGFEADRRVARVRRAPPAAALVEEHDPVGGRVEVAPPAGGAAGAGAAVQHDRRLPGRAPADLPVEAVAVAGPEHAALVRLDLRVEGHPPLEPEPARPPGRAEVDLLGHELRRRILERPGGLLFREEVDVDPRDQAAPELDVARAATVVPFG